MPFPPVERIRRSLLYAPRNRGSVRLKHGAATEAELRLTRTGGTQPSASRSGCGCITAGASTDSAESICKESIYARETTCSKRVPEKRHRLGGRPHLECCSARPRAAGSGQPPMIKGEREGEIGYGARSKYTTSVRIPHGGRPTPDNFGLTFHVASPLQDQVGVITPSSLHYYATTRGSFLPDIDPAKHTLMIHGLVDRPLTFTVDDLKRLPAVTRLHFIECAGNRASRLAKTVQETHGMTSNAEWTGVLLSTLLKECGLKGSAKWS